jgi:ubiquitin-conjugating enzyme E2 variant
MPPRELSSRPPADRLDLIAIATVVALLATIVLRIVRTASGLGDWLCVGIALPLGYPIADLATGIVHWAGDRIGDERTPLFKRFIAPFRRHHVRPLEITAHGFIETNGHNALGVLPVLLAVYLGIPDPTAFGLFVLSLITSAATLGLVSNQIHKWAHSPEVPRLVARLQRAGLILPPERHRLHHTPPFDQHYCITVGWLSEPLGRVGFFRALDRLVAAASAESLRRTSPLRYGRGHPERDAPDPGKHPGHVKLL